MSRFLTRTPCFSMDLNLEHPKVQNKPHFLRCGKTQGLFDLINRMETTLRSFKGEYFVVIAYYKG
ncbi:MAG: hypothetical protein Q7S27_05220 [Nanoarchaeota archaeon]|nr:hypothetical protein [Nanoarchaeota archaeon]